MRKGFLCFQNYPKLTCLCVMYVFSSFLFMFQIPPKQPFLHETYLLAQYTGYAPDKRPIMINETSQTTTTEDLKVHARKHAVKQSLTTNKSLTISTSKIEPVHFNNSDVKEQCDMTSYLSLNEKICDTVLSKGNNSLLSNMMTGKNSVLKEFNKKALKNLAGNVPILKDVIKQRKDNCNIDKVSENCDWLRISYMYGTETVSDEEELFPLAFAMKIHNNANQAHRLLRYIYRKHNTYCIHVDKKASVEIYNQFKRIESCFENIIVIEDRINVVYSTIRQVEAELKCMNALYKAKEAWEYYINLTGQEFMLKTNLEIVKILKLMNGTNDIESYPVPPTEYHKFKQKTFIMNNFPLITKQKKKPLQHNIKIHKGSAYGLFSREFVNFILNDNFVKEFLDWLRDAYAPEELIWATLQALPGTPGRRQEVVGSRGRVYISRAVKWKMDNTVTCHGKHVHWICIYGLKDIPWLLSNRNIVANKFYEDYEPLALDCVEKKMYERLVSGGVADDFNLDTYRQLLYLKPVNS